jgi:hypothetical protein
LCHIFGRQFLVHPSPALKIQIHCVWMQRALRAPRLSLNELGNGFGTASTTSERQSTGSKDWQRKILISSSTVLVGKKYRTGGERVRYRFRTEHPQRM